MELHDNLVTTWVMIYSKHGLLYNYWLFISTKSISFVCSIYYFGGRNEEHKLMNDFYYLDLRSMSWVKVHSLILQSTKQYQECMKSICKPIYATILNSQSHSCSPLYIYIYEKTTHMHISLCWKVPYLQSEREQAWQLLAIKWSSLVDVVHANDTTTSTSLTQR